MTENTFANGREMARSIEAVVLANAGLSEQKRTLTQEVVDALWSSGLMHWMNPKAAQGGEPGLLEMLDVWQELARQDGSVGWIGIANFPSAAFAAAYLNDEGFDEVFIKNEYRVTVGGQFAPNGMAEKVEGGYTLSGAWNFGSGTGHSQYVVGGFIPLVKGEMVMDDHTGLPDMQVAVIPRHEVTFTDGWHVQGLKGTGSYDYNVADLFVPEHRIFPLFTRNPQRGGHCFKLGVMPLTGAGHAAWALGVARSQLDDVLQLAKDKTRMGDPTTLSHKLTFQRNLAHHEGMWRAARAGVVDAFTRVEAAVKSGEELSVQMRLDMRLSATYATEACREICQFVHLAAGTTAIREGSRLERAFRDMYTGTQHAFINERTYTEAASVMLGLIEDSTAL